VAEETWFGVEEACFFVFVFCVADVCCVMYGVGDVE